MMKRRRNDRVRVAFVAGLLALGLVGAGAVSGTSAQAAVQSQAAKKKLTTFTVGIHNNADSFNPFLGFEAESYEVWALMYDYMISYRMSDMSPQPGLAKSWNTSDDGLTWTFDIRSGVQWSDGKPLTAADIAYTYNRILHGSTEQQNWASYLASVKTVTAPDATTVVLKLSKRNSVLPLLPMPIIPEHIWKNISEKQLKTYTNEKNVVGSGPFRLESGSVSGSTYIFKANPDYWGGKPSIDRLVFRVFKAEDTEVQALKKGDIDFAEDINPLQVRALSKAKNIKSILGDSPGFDEIAFNTGSVNTKDNKPIGNANPAVGDPKFRYALQFAIDRKDLAAKVYQGGGTAGVSIIPPAYKDYFWNPPASAAPTYDPKKAEQLLDAAGYKVGKDGWRTLPNGKPIGTLRLAARGESDTSPPTMQFMKEWLKDIHIRSKIVTMESGKLTTTILAGDFDMFQWGWYVEPDPDSILSDFTCGQRGGSSDSWYCSKQYDQLYNEQHSEIDHAKRADLVKQMQELLTKDAPYLVTAYYKIGEAYRSDRWHGFVPQPNPGGIYLFQYGVYNYIHIKPGPASGKKHSASTSHTGVVVGSVVGGTVLLALALFFGIFARRRKASVDTRE
jgi:peptide/nickel transport system substrate-binding protein